MKKKIRIIFFVIFFGLILFFVFVKFKPHNYESNYVIDKFKIKEIYNNEFSSYIFYIKNKDITYPFKLSNKYLNKRELVQKIKTYEKDKKVCILPISDYLEFYPLCSNNNEIIAHNLSDINIKEFKYKKINSHEINYKNLNINYFDDNKLLIYIYKGFYYINNNEVKEIKLFDKDIYTLNVLYQYDEYLIIADYNQKYYFDKFYIINLKNGRMEEIEFDFELSFETVFLGDFKNNIYFVDKKSEKEYKLNIKKKKIEQVDYIILKDKKLKKTTYKNLKNINFKFDNVLEEYKIINNKLYQIIGDYKILIINKEVTKIIKQDKNGVYYLSNEDLYMYDNVYGEIFLVKNFEWNFNNTNVIYLYK